MARHRVLTPSVCALSFAWRSKVHTRLWPQRRSAETEGDGLVVQQRQGSWRPSRSPRHRRCWRSCGRCCSRLLDLGVEPIKVGLDVEGDAHRDRFLLRGLTLGAAPQTGAWNTPTICTPEHCGSPSERECTDVSTTHLPCRRRERREAAGQRRLHSGEGMTALHRRGRAPMMYDFAHWFRSVNAR